MFMFAAFAGYVLMAAVSEFMAPYDADNATSAKHDVQNDRGDRGGGGGGGGP